MGNKVAYRLPSISLLSLDFPLPGYQTAQTSPLLGQSYYVSHPANLGPGAAPLPGSNAIQPTATPAYAYGDQGATLILNSPFEGSFSSNSGRGSPSGSVVPKMAVAAPHQINEAAIEFNNRSGIPSIAAITAAPALSSAQSSTVSSPPGYQYVSVAPQQQWPRHSSEYIISYNSPQGLSPSTSIVLSAGSTAPESHAISSKDSNIVATAPLDTQNTVSSQSPSTLEQHLDTTPEAEPPVGKPSPSSGRVLKPAGSESLKRKKRQCPECHLFFSNLATHKSTHLNPTARPHVCKICGRGFSRPNDLFRHFKCHWKKIGADGGQFKCPFKNGPRGSHCCHLLGIFSRCDTYKNHLKAIHFQYPSGTRKSERSFVPGCCRLCKKEFSNVDDWYSTHVDNGECSYIGKST